MVTATAREEAASSAWTSLSVWNTSCHVTWCWLDSRYYRTLEKQRQIDEQEQQSLLRDRERFLLCAVDNYINCLQHHDKYDLRVFRLISLWFDNAASDKISKSMQVCVCVCVCLCAMYSYAIFDLSVLIMIRVVQKNKRFQNFLSTTLFLFSAYLLLLLPHLVAIGEYLEVSHDGCFYQFTMNCDA